MAKHRPHCELIVYSQYLTRDIQYFAILEKEYFCNLI